MISDEDLTYSLSAETELIDFLELSSLGSRSLDGSEAAENNCDSSLGVPRLPKEFAWLRKPFSLISGNLEPSKSREPESGLTRDTYISAREFQDSYDYKKEVLPRRSPKIITSQIKRHANSKIQ